MDPTKPKPKTATKTSSNKKKTKTAQLSKEELEQILAKKKECNAKAQQIVLELIEPLPTDDVEKLKLKLKDITQAHFDDIIEERGITNLCGYPLCNKEIGYVLPQQYHISLSQKKVYDITERKNFCGSQCFKAANYLKAQLLSTPLWTRKEDDIIPDFKLLDLN